MQKITQNNVLAIIEGAQRKSFLLNPFYLIRNCFFENGEETLIFLDKDFLLFPPNDLRLAMNKKMWCLESDLPRIKASGIEIKSITPDSTDYFYQTKEYLKLSGHRFKNYRNKVRVFEKQTSPEIKEEYPAELTKEFVRQWYAKNAPKKKAFNRETLTAECNATLEAIDLLLHLPTTKALYVLSGGVLVGFAMYAALYPDFWVSIYEKVDHKYHGMSHWIFREKAKRMQAHEFFTNGDDGMDVSLAKHKKELQPVRMERNYLIETGEWQC